MEFSQDTMMDVWGILPTRFTRRYDVYGWSWDGIIHLVKTFPMTLNIRFLQSVPYLRAELRLSTCSVCTFGGDVCQCVFVVCYTWRDMYPWSAAALVRQCGGRLHDQGHRLNPRALLYTCAHHRSERGGFKYWRMYFIFYTLRKVLSALGGV